MLLAVPRQASSAQKLDGKDIFRFDTVGDEQPWTDKLQINQVIQSAVSPVVARRGGFAAL